MLRRLMRWLEPFTPCFGHPAQPVSLRAYINGLLGDSPRKSIQAMLARVTAPPDYQAVNHFITRAPWSAEKMWQIVRAQLPERQGALILDDTGFPKKGDKSVGVARQYTGTLGKIGNCQVAVTAALWTGRLAWLVGALLYLPEEWANDPARRNEAHIPRTVTFRRKWELALQLVRQVRASGIELTGILGDSGYGDATALRRALHQMRLSYGFGVSATVTVFHGTPQLQAPRKVRGPRLRRPRYTLGETPPPVTVRDLAASLPATAWRSVTWQHADNPRRTAQCAAVRVTPANDWQHGHVLPDVWLLCERPDGTTDEKYYLINLPANTRLPRLVTFMHQRWAIEQQYQQLKTELGFDHWSVRWPTAFFNASACDERPRLSASKPFGLSCKTSLCACSSRPVPSTPSGWVSSATCCRCDSELPFHAARLRTYPRGVRPRSVHARNFVPLFRSRAVAHRLAVPGGLSSCQLSTC